MSILNFILITVMLAGDLFATAYHSSEPHEKKTSCGPVLKPCACVTKNPCEIDYPAEIRRHALTAQDIRNYILTQSPEKLDLSWQNIKDLDKNAFDSCTDLTSLDLSHNEISKLPEYIFANLTNLEHLSLAGNNIKGTKNVFAGLNNLKTLDISGNPLTEILDDNCFFGLTNSCEITMRGVIGVKKIGTNAFGVQYSTSVQDTIDNDETKPKSIHARNAPVYPTSYSINENKIFDNFHAQICIEGDSVVRLDILKASENVTTGCKEISTKWKTYDLSKMGLSKFEKGWYRLNDKTQVPAQVSVMRLTNNNIVRVTSNIMNELSDYITWMDIAHNKIERLEEGCFEHKHIFSLLLNNNLISEIENNAFKMPALYQLYLEGNRLKDTKFAATLPSSLVSLNLDGNEITEISANSFSNLKSLSYLNLSKNKLTVLPNHCLRGATSINQLLISDNQITTVESRAFEDLRPFQIFLGGNKISSFEQGTFTEIVSLQQINVVRNKLTKIESTMFDQPNLRLLQLGGNNITLIEKGAVKNLKKLEKLDISKNPITRLENGALAGLNKMGKVYVDVTKTPIEVIQGGLFDDV